MKATGIVRKIDDLGRIVLPKELRKTMNIDRKDPMENTLKVMVRLYLKGINLLVSFVVMLKIHLNMKAR